MKQSPIIKYDKSEEDLNFSSPLFQFLRASIGNAEKINLFFLFNTLQWVCVGVQVIKDTFTCLSSPMSSLLCLKWCQEKARPSMYQLAADAGFDYPTF